MKKFSIHLFIYSAICVTALLLFELYLLRVPNRYSFKYNYIDTHKNEIEILLLGNCLIEDGLIPQILGPHTFNAAISGREKIYDAELAKQFIANMPKIKTVVLSVEYRDFAFGRGKVNPRDHKKHGGLKSTIKCMHYKYMNIHVDPFWYWSEFLNSELNYKERIHMTYQQQIETDTLGFVKLLDANKIPEWEYWDLPGIYDTSLPIDSEMYKSLYQSYYTIAQICSEHQVRLILTSLPVYKTFQQDMNPHVEKEIKEFTARIQREFPEVEYYNFFRDDRFHPEDFHDALHLSESGSRKFSHIISEIIGAPPFSVHTDTNPELTALH
jgi:hypothetical protein